MYVGNVCNVCMYVCTSYVCMYVRMHVCVYVLCKYVCMYYVCMSVSMSD
jgi:hypothetical protein